MTIYKEDEDLLQLISELINIQDKLEPDNNSKIKLVLSIDERKKLEDRWDELFRKSNTTKIELDRIRIRETPHHKAIVDFHIQKYSIKIWINLSKGGLDDPKKISRDVSNIGHWGNGDYELQVSSDDDLEYILSLIKQSLKKNKR